MSSNSIHNVHNKRDRDTIIVNTNKNKKSYHELPFIKSDVTVNTPNVNTSNMSNTKPNYCTTTNTIDRGSVTATTATTTSTTSTMATTTNNTQNLHNVNNVASDVTVSLPVPFSMPTLPLINLPVTNVTKTETIKTDNITPILTDTTVNTSANTDNNMKHVATVNMMCDVEVDNIFKPLSYEDVRINLRIMADIKEDERIMIIDGKYMQIDQRYVQWFRRYWTDDSKKRTIDFISHVITYAKKYCAEAVICINSNDNKQDNLTRLLDMQSLLNTALTGLNRFATTYKYDKLILATVENFSSTVKTFCDQDLKRATIDFK